MNEKLKKSLELLKKFNKNLEPRAYFIYDDNYVINVTLNGQYTIGGNNYMIDLKNERVMEFNMFALDEEEYDKILKTVVSLN